MRRSDGSSRQSPPRLCRLTQPRPSPGAWVGRPSQWRAELGLHEHANGLIFFLFAASCRLPQRCCKIGGLWILRLIVVHRLFCCPLVGRFGRPALFHVHLVL